MSQIQNLQLSSFYNLRAKAYGERKSNLVTILIPHIVKKELTQFSNFETNLYYKAGKNLDLSDLM